MRRPTAHSELRPDVRQPYAPILESKLSYGSNPALFINAGSKQHHRFPILAETFDRTATLGLFWMRILLHGDDLAASVSGTKRMFECVDRGALNSVSILANGVAFDDAVQGLLKRPQLRVALHLNLFERQPVAPLSGVSGLVGDSGEFHHSFASLWAAYLQGDASERLALRRAVIAEFSAQLEIVRAALGGGWKVEVDGHLHMHMVPFVFDCLMSLVETFEITYVRLPNEHYSPRVAGLTGWCRPNAVKALLLGRLCASRAKELRRRRIETCARFFGIYRSGAMFERAVLGAIDLIEADGGEGTAEILLHPAAADEREAYLWRNNKACRDAYLSPDRLREYEALLAPAVRQRLAVVQ